MTDPIKVTESAREAFSQMLKDNDREALRFGIKAGGCSGFAFFLEFASLDEIEEGDQLYESGDVKIIVDAASLIYILGTEIDWVNDLMGSYFSFKSPNQTSSCGCGQSVGF